MLPLHAVLGSLTRCALHLVNMSPTYRLERIEQLKQAQKQARFGTVEQITRADFVHQVTNAGEDVWVVVHLYKDK